MISCHVVVEKYGYVYEEIHQQDTVTTNTDSLFSARIRRWPETEDAMHWRLQNDASPCKKKLSPFHFLVEFGGTWINRGFHRQSYSMRKLLMSSVTSLSRVRLGISRVNSTQPMHAQKYSLIIFTASQVQFKKQPMQKRFISLRLETYSMSRRAWLALQAHASHHVLENVDRQ